MSCRNGKLDRQDAVPDVVEAPADVTDPEELISPCRDSLLTTTSGYTNYRGLLNLVIILLLLSNARAALENIIKYGILVDPFQWVGFVIEGSQHWPALMILAICGCNCLISFVIEKIIASSYQIKDHRAKSNIILAKALMVANLLACLVVPPYIIYSCRTNPISASGALVLVSVVFLKLVSFHMMNYWCRDVKRSPELRSRTTQSFLRSYVPPRIEFGMHKRIESNSSSSSGSSNLLITPPKIIQLSTNSRSTPKTPPYYSASKDEIKKASMDVLSLYPSNLNMDQFCMYLFYPTLCYELEYARTNRIRKRFLIKRTIEVIVLSQLEMALIQQWIVPTVNNSLIAFRHMQFSHMLERLLKLAIPNHVIWLIWFYTFFHSLLNIQAELTRFADREFYRDWWNSESVHYFWSHWNIPVHKWCARHLYLPLMSLGFDKGHAGTAVFFVSAFFHEYLVSVPLKMFRIWAFMGMLIQLPWARFVSSHFNNNSANVAVWVSIILGQPLCILMYYHDYYVMNHQA